MLIRDFQADDANTVATMMFAFIRHIREESHDPYFEWDQLDENFLRTSLPSSLNATDRKIFIAEVDNKIAGFLEAAVIPCFLPFSRTEKVGQIFATYIDPEYRGKGLIELLESAACSFFATLGIKYSELHVLTENMIAVSTWKRLGYTTFREQMRKSL